MYNKENTKTIKELFGLNAVKCGFFPDDIPKIKYPLDIPHETLVGIEIEVENIRKPFDLPYIWLRKEDGSLRNNGVEYVSYPIQAKDVPTALIYLKKELSKHNNPSYSKRTSIHVHVNVQDCTLDQLKSFTLLYLAFEKMLFSYVGGDREKSIFCVPLSHSGYTKKLRTFFFNEYPAKTILAKWEKYTSFNLRTACVYGTVEFRHLLGTDDVEKIVNWINLILDIKKRAMDIHPDKLFQAISELNSNSEYDNFISFVFPNSRQYLVKFNSQELMEDNVSHIKECFIKEEKLSLTDSFEESAFFKIFKLKKHSYPKHLEKLDLYSKEELQAYMIFLSSEYQKEDSEIERNKLSIEYNKVRNYLINQNINPDKVEW